MSLISFLLFSKAVAVQMSLYPVEDIVFIEVNGTAKISCSSNDGLDNNSRILWYRKSSALGEAPMKIVSCMSNRNPHKYLCNSDGNRTSLEIVNGQKKDSGIYYCALLGFVAEKGIRVIIGDTSTSNTTVQLLAPNPVPLDSQTIHLTCVVRTVQQQIHLIWNISGTHHRGKVIAIDEIEGTWNFVNHITVDRTHWHHGTLSCEVHFKFTVISAKLVNKEMNSTTYVRRCALSLIPVLTGIIVLLTILFGHLLWIFKQPGHKKTEQDTFVTDTQDGIVYAELDRGSLNPTKK